MITARPVGKADQRLLNITNGLLQDPEREMQVVNLIDFRANIAQGHIQFMNDLKAKTTMMHHSIRCRDSNLCKRFRTLVV